MYLIGLAAALVLWFAARRRVDAEYAAADGVADSVLGALDVAASQVKALVTSRGYRNNNPGNLRYLERNAWNGQVANDGGYGVYDTPANGSRALGRQLRAYAVKRGLRTVRDIISVWAPPTENNTSAYVRHVASRMNLDPDAPFDVVARLGDLADAIALHENGTAQPWGDAFYQWVNL